MAKLQNLEHVVLDLIENGVRAAGVRALNLGGLSGPGGGVGGPPGGFIGWLPQTRVSYDETEAATLNTPASGQSLVDNLNHIRYRLSQVENGILIVDDWDGSPTINDVVELTFSGAIVSQVGPGHALVVLSGGGGGSALTVQEFDGSPIINNTDKIIFSGVKVTDLGSGDALVEMLQEGGVNRVVLTDSGGNLTTKPWLKWGTSTEDFIEFGADEEGKEANAGKMGYETFGAGFFFIVGAGTAAPRKVKIFDDLYVDGNLFAHSGNTVMDHLHDHIGGDGNPITEGAFSFSDVTTANASTSAHGLLLKATAPAANVLNVVGIANGETVYANKTLFDGTNPQSLGTAAPGTSLIASHRDHVHAIPNFITYLPAHGLNGTIAASTTMKAPIFFYGLNSSSFNFTVSKAGTLKNLSVWNNSTQPGTGSLVITVFLNNSASALTVTYVNADGVVYKQDTTHTVAVVAGDLITISLTNNASSASAQVNSLSIELEMPVYY